MSEFTIWVIRWSVASFVLSWLLFGLHSERFATMFAVFSALAMVILLIMGLDEIIHFIATSLGF